MLIGLLISMVNASNHTKSVLLSNLKCMTQPTLINLHPNEYSQELYYCPFAVKLDRCVESCNTLNNLPHKVCVSNKTADLNLSVLNMISRINELKTLAKHISCECKYKFDGRKCNSNQKWNKLNVNVSIENIIYVKKIIFGILLHVLPTMLNI